MASASNDHPFPVPAEIDELARVLEQGFPDHLLMPCVQGMKVPKYRYAGYSWTRELWNELKGFQPWQDWALMIRHPFHLPEGAPAVMVVDCDSPEAVAFVEALDPMCLATVSVNTDRGKHFYFCPTPEATAGLSTFASHPTESPIRSK